MELKGLLADRGEKLDEVLKKYDYKNIPSNVVLNKTLTGIGATYSELHANRHSIIIEPNVPVIIGKSKKYGKALAVWEKCTPAQVRKYLLDGKIKYKKILTTPEGFRKVRAAAEKVGVNIYKDYFCLFDECEKLTQDVDYRKNITQPIYDFFEFKSKAFVSATPLIMEHPEIEKQNFKHLSIEPAFDYKENIELIITNNVYRQLELKLQALSTSKSVCVFSNSLKWISKIIETLGLSDYKIFCSEKKQKELSVNDERVFSNIELPLAKYNFFTSRFYSAVDIDINYLVDVVIFTDLNAAKYTAVDPFSESIQIKGRFRKEINGKRINSLTHISNIIRDYSVKTDEEIQVELNEYKRTYLQLSKRLDEADSVSKKAIEKDIGRLEYSILLNDSGVLNSFAVNNLFNEERVKRYYTDRELLYQAYLDTGHFNVNLNIQYALEDELRLRTVKQNSVKKKVEIIVEELNKSQNFNLDFIRQSNDPDFYHLVNTVNKVYEKEGAEFFIKCKYDLKKIEKKLHENESEVKRFSKELICELVQEFEACGDSVIKNKSKEIIQEIYNKYGVVAKVTQKTIIDYYNLKTDNSVKPAIYKLQGLKLEIKEILESN